MAENNIIVNGRTLSANITKHVSVKVSGFRYEGIGPTEAEAIADFEKKNAQIMGGTGPSRLKFIGDAIEHPKSAQLDITQRFGRD